MSKRWFVSLAVVLPLLLGAGALSYGAKAPAPRVRAGGSYALPPRGTAPVLPADIPGGAPNASLAQAAAFAWDEFFAATWPAKPSGPGRYNRDQADPNGIYGQQAASPSGPPLVWETYRHKVEIFPGTTATGNQGYQSNMPPHGATQGPPDYGYNDPPQYDYAPGNVTGPCNPGDPANSPTAWVNLDENSQIFLDTMYAGINDPKGRQPAPSQELLFLAKANRVDYVYAVDPRNAGGTQLYQGFWNHSFPTNGGGQPANSDNPQYNAALNDFQAYRQAVLTGGGPAAPPIQRPYVSLPPGTVEVKSAWRPLTPGEAQSGRFHTAMVRFYNSTANGKSCYRQAPWGMLALHIIQKTPTAPYFVYATFSQADNILVADPQGHPVPVENAEGRMVVQDPGYNLDSGFGSNAAKNPVRATTLASSANPNTEIYNVTNTAPCVPGVRLYYQNTTNTPPPNPVTQVTPQGNVCVNQRTHRIPDEIIAANQAAHDAIRAYNLANNGGRSTPWLYYKLVNVQAAPINKPNPGGIYTGSNAATYYQSNEVVETNYNLQFFSGRLVSGYPSNGALMSDFNNATSGGPAGSVFKNTFYLRQPSGTPVSTYNMGGCMGCHGNAQQAGDDFSFILNVGRNDSPDNLPTAGNGALAAHVVSTAAKFRKFHLAG